MSPNVILRRHSITVQLHHVFTALERSHKVTARDAQAYNGILAEA
jgi:hypothetical protein